MSNIVKTETYAKITTEPNIEFVYWDGTVENAQNIMDWIVFEPIINNVVSADLVVRRTVAGREAIISVYSNESVTLNSSEYLGKDTEGNFIVVDENELLTKYRKVS